MNLRNLAIVFGIALGALPVTLFATLALLPFWRWLEAATGIESIGHSGPAAWCYLAIYGLLLSLGGIIGPYRRRRAGPPR